MCIPDETRSYLGPYAGDKFSVFYSIRDHTIKKPGPAPFAGPDFSCRLPEAPRPAALAGFAELPGIFPGVEGEPEEVALETATLIASLQDGVLPCEFQAVGVHREETLVERPHRNVAAVSLDPEAVITKGAHLGCVFVLLVSFPRPSYPEEETCQGFMRAAPLQQPLSLASEGVLAFLQAGNPFPVGQGALVDEGGNHADLATFGPCNKGISLV